jgi:NAD(P)-dependent dehydrogenase (short-subunit alcohol dehydrogenase family)
MPDLAGQVALVTGGGRGLGRGFAEHIATCGAHVVVAGRRQSALDETVSSIIARGGAASAFALDLKNAEDIDATVSRITSSIGPIAILVNNAGVADSGRAETLELATIDALIDVNFRAPYLTCCAVAQHLIEHGLPGRIINIGTSGTRYYQRRALSALYVATKSAVQRLTETLAIEWAEHAINVNAIVPGMFISDMTRDFVAQHGERVVSRFPRRRFGTSDRLHSTLDYLLSPESDFVTGTCIVVDDAQTGR